MLVGAVSDFMFEKVQKTIQVLIFSFLSIKNQYQILKRHLMAAATKPEDRGKADTTLRLSKGNPANPKSEIIVPRTCFLG
jgi:hypothetical protein